MELAEKEVMLVVPELKIPVGYIFKGDVLLGEVAIPQQDIVFKDVQIDASALIEEIVRRVVAEMTAIVLGLPSKLLEAEAEKRKAELEEALKRRMR